MYIYAVFGFFYKQRNNYFSPAEAMLIPYQSRTPTHTDYTLHIWSKGRTLYIYHPYGGIKAARIYIYQDDTLKHRFLPSK